MKKFYFLITLSLFSVSISAQPYSLDWVNTLQNTTSISTYQTVVDVDNNTYNLGSYLGNTDFDASGNKAILIDPTDPDFSAFFLSKNDSYGNLKWAIGFTGHKHNLRINAVKTDSEGNVFIVGSCKDSLLMNHTTYGASTYKLTSGTSFLIKFDKAGRLLWLKQLSGIGLHSVVMNDLTITSDDKLLITGGFGGTIDFDFGSGVDTLRGYGDLFILKTDNMGNHIWAKKYGSTEDISSANKINTDPYGNILLTGNFQDTLYFEATDYVYSTPSRISLGPGLGDTLVYFHQDLFIAKFDSSGTHIFSHSLNSGNNFKYFGGIVGDKNGNVTIAGSFSDTLKLDFVNTLSAQTNGGYGFIIQFDPSGNISWSQILNGAATGMAYYGGLATDTAGNLYSGGRIDGWVDLNPGPSVNADSTKGLDIFLQKLDAQGNYLWSHIIGGDNSDYFGSITADSKQNLITTGAFSGKVDFDPTKDIYEQQHNGICLKAAFTLKLKTCEYSTGQEVVHGCENVIINNTTYSHSGFFVDTISSSANGCDSIVRMEVRLSDIDTNIFVRKDGSLYSREWTANSLQWVDCNDNFKPIPGATNQDFKPTANGSYAVLITRDSCSAYSACYNYQVVSNEEFDQLIISIFPNPVKDILTVDFAAAFEGAAEVKVYDANGQLVREKKEITESKYQINLSTIPAGIYIVQARSGTRLFSKKLIKE